MPINLKDIGKSLVTNPFLNPLGALANQQKTKKELEAIKNAQANQGSPDYSQYVPGGDPSNTPPPSKPWPTWAVITISLAGVTTLAVIIGLTIRAIKNKSANK